MKPSIFELVACLPACIHINKLILIAKKFNKKSREEEADARVAEAHVVMKRI